MSKKLLGMLIAAAVAIGGYGFFRAGNFLPDGNHGQPVNPTTTQAAPGNTKSPDISHGMGQTQPEKSLRFVVLADSRGTDNGVNSKAVKQTMANIKKLSPQPEFAVMPGDLVDGDKNYSKVKAQLQYFKSIITRYYPSDFFYPGIGNHEIAAGQDGERAFSEVFNDFTATFLDGYNRTAYYFDRGNSRFFMLNSDHPGEVNKITERQYDWLTASIVKAQKHNLFFVHAPPYPTGPHIGSSLDVDRFLRDKLWELVDKASGPMLFCGHEHFYTRRHIDSSFNESVNGADFKFSKTVYQVTVGSFGAPLYSEYKSKKEVDVAPIAKYHYVVVDINGDIIKAAAYDLDGNILDSFQQ